MCRAVSSACGSHMSGTYVNSDAMGGKMTFVSGSKVQVEILGTITECSYEKNGDQVKLINGDKNQILTIDKDGCSTGGNYNGEVL